ncbi:MAG: serine/threonine protein kinase, partial [Acidobacteria bacterium]|nr:serine/threonine protein kinase [Acidobacteriota bacterium]
MTTEDHPSRTPEAALSDPEREGRLFDLLQEVLGWPPEERQWRLEEACDGTGVEAGEILELLEEEDELGDFLETPLVPTPPDAVPEPGPEVLPERIGAFRILRLLGEGGMGRVFLAEQREPVVRRVALNLMRGELLSKEGRARFLAEQQALARLDHAHIARLLEAGVTDDHHPFFAMEWVDGEPLLPYCDARALSVEARLEIFLEICAAVQHAHQKQVLHRDLKPSNVLVAEPDGRPVPKVIDFGIAKSLGQDLGLTGSFDLVGTPLYMS